MAAKDKPEDNALERMVSATISVNSSGAHVRVVVIIENRSQETIYVHKVQALQKPPFYKVFLVQERPGKSRVEYLGPMGKFRSEFPDDYVAIAGGSKLPLEADITESFAFKPGQRYAILYQVFASHGKNGVDGLLKVESPWTEFTMGER